MQGFELEKIYPCRERGGYKGALQSVLQDTNVPMEGVRAHMEGAQGGTGTWHGQGDTAFAGRGGGWALPSQGKTPKNRRRANGIDPPPPKKKSFSVESSLRQTAI